MPAFLSTAHVPVNAHKMKEHKVISEGKRGTDPKTNGSANGKGTNMSGHYGPRSGSSPPDASFFCLLACRFPTRGQIAH